MSLKKIKQIAEGWKNSLMPQKDKIDLINLASKERLVVCNGCEYHSKYHRSVRPDAHCTDCGCTLIAKTKCLSCECPRGKWESINIKE